MKAHLFLSFSALCMIVCIQAQGQTYYNFALGGVSPYTSTPSIIRPIDTHRAVAYYNENGSSGPALVLIDLTAPYTINGLRIKREYDVKDIRVVNGEVFFCGWNTNNSDGFIGHVKVSDLSGSVMGSVDCYDLSVGPRTIMWRLAAYDDGLGSLRVVCLGNTWYEGNNAPSFPTCPPLSICQGSFFVECKYGPTLSIVGSKVVGDMTRFERADDLVVTDNWVAIISGYLDDDAIVIHRCKKSDVIGTFDNYSYYVVPCYEGINHCCIMKGDTIADATTYNTFGTAPYESHLRVFDLGTMQMIQAQRFDLLDKVEPVELAYFPNKKTLVMLQNMMYPSYQYHYTFVHWTPYNPATYYARLMYERNDNQFGWMDKLTSMHIVASGGDYWMMKDISYDDPLTNCYNVEQQQVTPLGLSYTQTNYYPYYTISITLSRMAIGEPMYINMSPVCITY